MSLCILYKKTARQYLILDFLKLLILVIFFYQDEEESPSETATLNMENVDEKSSDLQRYHEIHAVICSI